jgi:small subunit ribosomal protein S17
MADEEKNEQDQQEQEPQAEGSDASAAGPVAEENGDPGTPGREAEEVPGGDSSPEDAPSTPPAEEAEEDAAEAPASEEEPEAVAEAASADEGEELPWKVRRRLERSRRPHEPRPQRGADERATARREARRAKASARSRYRRSQRAKAEAGTGTPPVKRRSNPPKVRQGVVVSDKADKTITVRIDIVRRHPAYEKIVRSSRTLHAHDERNEAGPGDVVRVVETRPLSRTKRWRLLEVLEKAR